MRKESKNTTWGLLGILNLKYGLTLGWLGIKQKQTKSAVSLAMSDTDSFWTR